MQSPYWDNPIRVFFQSGSYPVFLFFSSSPSPVPPQRALILHTPTPFIPLAPLSDEQITELFKSSFYEILKRPQNWRPPPQAAVGGMDSPSFVSIHFILSLFFSSFAIPALCKVGERRERERGSMSAHSVQARSWAIQTWDLI